MSWDVTDDLTVTSLTGYSKGTLFSRSDYNRVSPINTLNAVPGISPGGVFNDPQIGSSNKFATFDISSADSEQWSQELRLQSAYAGPLNFNIGAIAVDFENLTDYFVMGNTLTAYAAILNGGKPCPINTPTCIYIDPNQTPTGDGHNYYDSRSPYHLKSKAVFGEVYYELSDSFKLTGGLRYTHDRKSQINMPVVLFAPGSGHPLGVPAEQIADFKEMTGRFGFDWKPDLAMTDSSLIYAFYSRGYKAGGINPPQSAASELSVVKSAFDPEFVTSFEVGMKNTMLDGTLILNATAFHYDYTGYQVSKIVNRVSVNENIDAEIQGIEVESIWEPINNLRFNASLGLLETKIGEASSIDTFNRTQGDPSLVVIKASNASNCTASKAGVQGLMTLINAGALAPTTMLGVCSGAFTGAANPLKPYGIDIPFGDGIAKNLKGNELPNSPKATLSVGAQYTFELPAGWGGTVRGDYYQQGQSYARIYNSAADRIDSWQNVNASLQISNESNGIQLEAYVKNLLDDDPITDVYLTDDSSGLFRNGFLLEPRTFGFAIQKSF